MDNFSTFVKGRNNNCQDSYDYTVNGNKKSLDVCYHGLKDIQTGNLLKVKFYI